MLKRLRSSLAKKAGSDADAKKQKPRVHVCTLAITIPHNTDPESPKIDAATASKRAAQNADKNATNEETYGKGEYAKFAKPFEAAVASAFVENDGPVSLTKVITAMTKATGKVKIGKERKERFVWDGFNEGRWIISRAYPGHGQVAFPKGTARDKSPERWRFSPSPAARCPLAELTREP